MWPTVMLQSGRKARTSRPSRLAYSVLGERYSYDVAYPDDSTPTTTYTTVVQRPGVYPLFTLDVASITSRPSRDSPIVGRATSQSTSRTSSLSPRRRCQRPPMAGSTANANGKCQRTLLDMQFAPDAAKRQKLASQPAYAARFTAGPSKPLALQKLTNPTKKLNAIPFSLSIFVATLPSDETRVLLALECNVLGKSWLKVLTGELTQAYFLALKRFLYTEGVCGAGDPAPTPKNIYAWSDTSLSRVKVVILGQDPYPSAGQAHGLSFSVPKGVSVPGSLQNRPPRSGFNSSDDADLLVSVSHTSDVPQFRTPRTLSKRPVKGQSAVE
ncbi:hypothetical protein C8R44DRAFT_744565 [Mycena epipterygia]|nr:hypothetical protein C8R44DRAFT_744565 [Mycena epipterygia]